MSLAEDIEYEPNLFEDYGDSNWMYSNYLEKELCWRTKDGNHILVQNLEDLHILNILKMSEFPDSSVWMTILMHELYDVRKYTEDVFKDVIL